MSKQDGSYEVVDQRWPSDPPAKDSKTDDVHAKLAAIERYCGVEFRDSRGSVAHRYDYPSTDQYFFQFRHYFRYFGTKFLDLDAQQIKFRFLLYLIALVRKVAANRGRVSILEVGGTLGENYLLLKDAVALEGLDVKINYVGIDHDNRVVNLARELHAGDTGFSMVHGEGSDLSRFPDQTFDIVASNSVHNCLADPRAGYQDAFRVSRVAVLLQLLASRRQESIRSISAQTGHVNHFPALGEVMEFLRPMQPYYIYRLSKYWSTGLVENHHGQGDGAYLDGFDAQTLRWNGWIFSRYDCLPELALVRSLVDSEKRP